MNIFAKAGLKSDSESAASFYTNSFKEILHELENPERKYAQRARGFFRKELKISDIDAIPFFRPDELTVYFSRQMPSDSLETRQIRHLAEAYGMPLAVTDCSIDSYGHYPFKADHARKVRKMVRDGNGFRVEHILLSRPAEGEVMNTIMTVDGESLVEYHKKLFAERNKGVKIHDLGSALLEAFGQSLDNGYQPNSVWVSGEMWAVGDNAKKRTISEKYVFDREGKKYVSASGIYEKSREEIRELLDKGALVPPAEFNYDAGFGMLALSPVLQIENWDDSGRMEALAAGSFGKVAAESGVRPLIAKYYDADMHKGLAKKLGRNPNHVIVGEALGGIEIAASGDLFEDSKKITEAMYDGLFVRKDSKIKQAVL